MRSTIAADIAKSVRVQNSAEKQSFTSLIAKASRRTTRERQESQCDSCEPDAGTHEQSEVEVLHQLMEIILRVTTFNVTSRNRAFCENFELSWHRGSLRVTSHFLRIKAMDLVPDP